MSAAVIGSVPASGGDALAEAVALTRRLKLPHCQRQGRARVGFHVPSTRTSAVTSSSCADRAGAALRPRRARPGTAHRGGRRPRREEPAHAAPTSRDSTGTALHDWDAAASCIPRPTQDALTVSPDAAEGFYRLVDAAYARRSLAGRSNLHPSGFDEIMPKTLPTASVERLLHRSGRRRAGHQWEDELALDP